MTVKVCAWDDGKSAVIEVSDTGPGLPAGEEERMFEMFVTSRPEGTGLGLFLARAAVERCGGTLSGGNRPEGGACFRITLPLAPAAHDGRGSG